MKSSHVASWALIPLLAFAPSCGGGDTTGDTSTGTDTSTDTGTDTSTDTGTDTSTDVFCTDDAACAGLGLICNESLGVCVAPGCEGKDDFTLCETVTSPDRSYDICVNEACVSPGCGDETCNVPGPHFPLPDTNQRQCYDAAAAVTCPSPGQPFHGQDAQVGWDTTHAATERFTRDLTVSAQPVVTDNVTALVWQGCTLGLSGDDCATGFVAKASWDDQLASCDSLTWGGHDDWRLPDPYELQTLVNCDTATPPGIDTTVFPATPLDWFWSSSSSVQSSWAWTVQFAFGVVASDVKANSRSARCIRGGPLKAPRFEASTLSGDRVVTDTLHGLMWQGCPEGTSGDTCGTGTITWSTWEGALAYCEGLSWGGFTDWRLPDIDELQSIVDYRYVSTSVDPAVFPGLSSNGWSSTTRATTSGAAWVVNFEFGTTSSIAKTDMGASVRCARSQ
jgi:hypothetical protein